MLFGYGGSRGKPPSRTQRSGLLLASKGSGQKPHCSVGLQAGTVHGAKNTPTSNRGESASGYHWVESRQAHTQLLLPSPLPLLNWCALFAPFRPPGPLPSPSQAAARRGCVPGRTPASLDGRWRRCHASSRRFSASPRTSLPRLAPSGKQMQNQAKAVTRQGRRRRVSVPRVRQHCCQLPGWRGWMRERRKHGHRSAFRPRSSNAWPSSLPALYLGPGAPGAAGRGPEPLPGGEDFESRHVRGPAAGGCGLECACECDRARCPGRRRATGKRGEGRRAGGGPEARPRGDDVLGPPALRLRRPPRLSLVEKRGWEGPRQELKLCAVAGARGRSPASRRPCFFVVGRVPGSCIGAHLSLQPPSPIGIWKNIYGNFNSSYFYFRQPPRYKAKTGQSYFQTFLDALLTAAAARDRDAGAALPGSRPPATCCHALFPSAPDRESWLPIGSAWRHGRLPIGLGEGAGERRALASPPRLKSPCCSGLWEREEARAEENNPEEPLRPWVDPLPELGSPPTNQESSAPTPRPCRGIR
ncbi:hypothetical protein HPG69_003382 [Diceros bicornis minor]|uniref:Uncharacterized protein n=1 Tax=Diceros bicornis minor TaxID=77932 RepID=A0A7J7E8P6_DICBM|nr:hypothetical protein HPG69_003382 [Diceros bicornis minor]